MTEEKPVVRWHFVPSVNNVAAPTAAEISAATDITPYIDVSNAVVRDLTFRYAKPPVVAEGVTRAWQVIWSGGPGPALAREVSVLADGVVSVEPLSDWQYVTVVDDARP